MNAEQMALYNREYSSLVHGKIRIPDTRWCVLRYPNPGHGAKREDEPGGV